jgi:hypothetical protein
MKTASWAELYQPTDIQNLDLAEVATEEAMQPSEPSKNTQAPNMPNCNGVVPPEAPVSSHRISPEYSFPYATEVGNVIKQIIADKNPTAARRFIPGDQGIQSVRGVVETGKAIKDNNLVVEKSRRPGPRSEVHWCRYRAQLVNEKWEYSTVPCYSIDGCNTGFSSWDIAVRHLKEKHYGMHIPRFKKVYGLLLQRCMTLTTSQADKKKWKRRR